LAKKRNKIAAYSDALEAFVAALTAAHPELSKDELAQLIAHVGPKSRIGTVMFSSDSNEWETPKPLFDKLDTEFHFTLDPCATDKNHLCVKYFTKADDGLSKPWGNHRVFVNPPYGNAIPKWVKKSYEESLRGALVVMLVPARTETRYWHEYCMKGEIRFIKGRIGFINRTLPSYKENGKFKISAAPFPSAIVIFGSGKRSVSSYGFKAKNDGYYVQQKLGI